MQRLPTCQAWRLEVPPLAAPAAWGAGLRAWAALRPPEPRVASAAQTKAAARGACAKAAHSAPHDLHLDLQVSGPEALGDALRAAAAPHIDVAPLPGRVVIFRSTLLHEAHTRCIRAA